ncbi:MAG: hypothetical protein KBF72_00300 [Candidatus Syntrophosphaera sp.]|jgi:hypothetical protein|nr:hypothetical protein [Candidatus Syntrophosphaera sp.]
MKKFFKNTLIVAGVALAAHFGVKAYKRINGVVKLSKSLGDFLNNVYGTKPKVSINSGINTINSTNIKVQFPQEILDKYTDIETTIREYIDDFYPELAKTRINIDIQPLTEEEDMNINVEVEQEATD